MSSRQRDLRSLLATGLLLGTASAALASVSFAPQATFPAGRTPDAVAVADFNHDGLHDVVVTNVEANTISVLLAQNGGTLGPHVEIAVGVWPTAVISADFDDDGNADLAVVNDGFVLFQDPEQGSVSILLGQGDGSFAKPVVYKVGLRSQSVVAADFDEDGVLDLVVTNRGTLDISLLIGNGDGTFGRETRFALLNLNGPEAIAAGDFNDDGHLDVAVTKANGSRFRLFFGAGDGSFAFDLGEEVGPFVRTVAAGDFNEDGLDDLAVGNDGPVFPGFDGVITIMRGIGTNGLIEDGDFGVGRDPTSATVDDFDLDGHQDVVSVHPPEGQVSILVGDGTGEFAPEVRFDLGLPFPRAVAVGDVNGDGQPDLAVTAGLDDSVLILLNTTSTGAIPTVTEWGLLVMALLLVLGAIKVFR